MMKERDYASPGEPAIYTGEMAITLLEIKHTSVHGSCDVKLHSENAQSHSITVLNRGLPLLPNTLPADVLL